MDDEALLVLMTLSRYFASTDQARIKFPADLNIKTMRPRAVGLARA